ncbi:hypothetical protein GCM10009808_04880 [Microbacterium sediminicola]|uniref:Uncharacterized protein n=1 Tax=Microbacterium sediminicola TaxID=415210 RepID=A0ABP4TNR0_9MICO
MFQGFVAFAVAISLGVSLSASPSIGHLDQSAEDTALIVTEPTSVTVLGMDELDLGETVSVEELITEAEDVGQPVDEELAEVLEEVTSDKLEELSDAGADHLADAGDATRPRMMATVYKSAIAKTASDPAYGIVSQWWDNKSIRVTVRKGTSTWGWTHVQKHNVSMTMIQKTTKFPKTRSVSGSTITYQTPAMKFTCWLATCWVEKSMDVRVVSNNTRLTDGSPKGVITAYCVGPTVCPAWVRQVAG